MNIAQIQAALTAGATIDWSAALAAVESGNVDGEFQTAEEALDVAAVFFPQAALIKDAMMVMSLIYDGYRTGRIKSASPDDAAMERVTGSKAR